MEISTKAQPLPWKAQWSKTRGQGRAGGDGSLQYFPDKRYLREKTKVGKHIWNYLCLFLKESRFEKKTEVDKHTFTVLGDMFARKQEMELFSPIPEGK